MGLTLSGHTPLNRWTPGPIEALADEAAEWVTSQIYARYAPVLMPFGVRGRKHVFDADGQHDGNPAGVHRVSFLKRPC